MWTSVVALLGLACSSYGHIQTTQSIQGGMWDPLKPLVSLLLAFQLPVSRRAHFVDLHGQLPRFTLSVTRTAPRIIGMETDAMSDKVEAEAVGDEASRFDRVENLVQKAFQRIDDLESQIKHLKAAKEQSDAMLRSSLRHGATMFRVGHYNVLAGYMGRNMEPWFLYGLEDLSPERRELIFKKHGERGPDGKPVYAGWPNYVQGILSPAEISQVEAVHRKNFAWDARKDRLLQVIQDMNADILSLVECDHYEDHFEPGLGALGYDSVWRKRPRSFSQDGCCVSWKRAMFELVAERAVEFDDSHADLETTQKDRIALMVLLRVRMTGKIICVISTHLARNPEVSGMDYVRTRQLLQLMEALGEFTQTYAAEDAAVVLTGDLNAPKFDRLRGLACTIALLRNKSQVHPFLFDCQDVPTGPTSVTTARQMRIDAMMYQTERLELVGKSKVPDLSPVTPIPNDEHPSDHVPIAGIFDLQSQFKQDLHNARAWYLQIAGRTIGWLPLNMEDLQKAYSIYDIDGSGTMSASELQQAMVFVMGSGVVGPDELQKVLQEFPEDGVDFEMFVDIYKKSVEKLGTQGLANFRDAFNAFDEGGDGAFDFAEFARLFQECSSSPVAKEELEHVFQSIDTDGNGKIEIEEFLVYLSNLWVSRFLAGNTKQVSQKKIQQS